jgi:hypothetical protein
MLNPWLQITFQAARLGFEAQNAVALRLLRLVGDANKPPGTIADKVAMPLEVQASATKVASDEGRTSQSVHKVHKKRMRVNNRRRSKK